MAKRLNKWYSLGVSSQELHLDYVLPTGQSFRWRKKKDGLYAGVIGKRVLELKQTQEGAFYRTVYRAPSLCAKDDASTLHEYFNLDVPLSSFNERWSKQDSRFKALLPHVPGARVLRQDPLECLFQFICSSNNNISRIQGMVDRLCAQYGELLQAGDCRLESSAPANKKRKADKLDQTSSNSKLDKGAFYAFPTLEQLSKATEDELLGLGFGYRAKYVTGTVRALLLKPEGGDIWLLGLREVPYSDASKELRALPGVGPKVAACVCLFSLDKNEAVPVDTHIWQLANREYSQLLHGRKTLTEKLMWEIEAGLISVFGPYAGWALSMLFIAELVAYRDHIPTHLRPPALSKGKGRKTENQS